MEKQRDKKERSEIMKNWSLLQKNVKNGKRRL